MPWDPEQYHRFQEERTAPFHDLLQLVRKEREISAVDLGCGTGELTRRLADALEGSTVTGVDSSGEMLERARRLEGKGLSFRRCAIEEVEGNYDLVFSNAALHWVERHDLLFPRLLSLLNPGGQLAVQLPANHRHPGHTLMTETALEEPFRSALQGYLRESPVLEIDAYAALIFHWGAADIQVFEKVYLHPLPDADSIDEWTSGTTMIPYLERLPKELHRAFRERYRHKLRQEFPGSPVLYTFRRIFLSASRSRS